VAAAAVVLLAVPTAAQASPVHDQLVRLGLLPAATSYTELAFASPLPLAQAVQANGATTLTFSVHNVSASTHVYRWAVTQSAASGGGTVRAGSGTVSVAAAETRRVKVSTRIASCKVRTKVQVQLTDDSAKVESIDFWVVPQVANPAANAGSAHCGGN
jgi:hypothetical protein